MPIFKVNDYKLAKVQECQVKRESHIQKLIELNLKEIFGLEYISGRITREFTLHGLRIDTLAFDPVNHAFVIIEYKRGKSCSVIDQGLSYLALMLHHKGDFILEYNQLTGSNLNPRDINWSLCRVIFVANSFTTHQQIAVNFKSLPIELWEVRKFDNNTFLFQQLKPFERGLTSVIRTANNSKCSNGERLEDLVLMQ